MMMMTNMMVLLVMMMMMMVIPALKLYSPDWDDHHCWFFNGPLGVMQVINNVPGPVNFYQHRVFLDHYQCQCIGAEIFVQKYLQHSWPLCISFCRFCSCQVEDKLE